MTNVLFGPWVERRKTLAAERRKYELEPAVCSGCQCQVPQWFAKRTGGKDTPEGRPTAAEVCWQCMGLADAHPRPYEQLVDFNDRVTKERKLVLKKMKEQMRASRKNGQLPP